MWWLAGGPVVDGIDLSTLTGAAGGASVTFVLALVLTRKGIVPEWTLRKSEEDNERLRAENAELREQIEKLNESLQTQLIPILVKSNEIVGAYNDEVRIRRLSGGRDGS